MGGRGSQVNPDNFLVVNKYLKEGSTVDLGCGEVRMYDYRVDSDESVNPDLVHDLNKPLPLEDNSFTNAILIHILEHIENDLQLLEEAKRVATERVIGVVPLGYRDDLGHIRKFNNKEEPIKRYEPDEVDLSSVAGMFDLVMIFDTNIGGK